MTTARIATAVLIAFALGSAAFGAGLDFETYRARVEPVFLKKRPGHARCVVCHESNNAAFHLEALAPGTTTWTEAQSRRNFESVSRLVIPGKAAESRLLLHPLVPGAGGDYFHGGGRQFASRDDPEWKVIAEWINSVK